jgi:F0F1-type ATP synthase membrane subunit b/b'
MHLLAFAEPIHLFPDGTMFLHIAILLVMIWALNRTFFRPINRIIEGREKMKGSHSTEADEILKNVESKEARYNKELLDARSQGYELTEKEQQKAVAKRNQKISEAKAEVAAKFEAGKADLEKQVADARTALSADAEKAADKIATNILQG